MLNVQLLKDNILQIISSIKLLSHVRLFATPWTAARQAPCPSPTTRVDSNSRPSSRRWHPTISSSAVPFSSHLQSFQASGSFPMSQFFASGGKVLEFQLQLSPSNEHSGLISFRLDWLDLLAVQGRLKSLLQHHSSKASILRYSAFFAVQLTPIYDYWKNHSLLDRTLLAK